MMPFQPSIHVERRRKYINKLKTNGTFEDFKKKRALLEKNRRIRLKDSLAKLPSAKRIKLLAASRLKCSERVKKCREKKVELHRSPTIVDIEMPESNSSALLKSEPLKRFSCTSVNFQNSYKTDGAMLKAATKIRKVLPSSPSKSHAALAKVLYSLDDEAQKKIFDNKTKSNKGGAKGIPSTLIQDIHEFYEKDNVSRMSPNVKDTKNFYNPITGQKEIKQLRHMIVTLQEAYDLFVEENAGAVKISKFSSLRPVHVKLMSSMPHNICLCIYHSNYSECCNVLHKHLPEFPAYGPELTQFFVCDKHSKACNFKTCANCDPTIIEEKLRKMTKKHKNTKKTLTWKLWEKDEVQNRTQRYEKNGTVIDLMDYFISIYQGFLKHAFTNHVQMESFNNDLKDSKNKENECVLQSDYAENFTCESQDEVQPAHWNQKQISAFTSALHYMGKVYSKVIVSDNTDHSKDTLVAYLYKLLSGIPKKIKIVKLWSDGPNSQFKNKYIAAVIKLFEKKFGIKLIWNYFATAHGKGCIDGIGAVAKSKVKRLVQSRKATVNCAKDFVIAFNSKPSLVQLFEMTSTDINKINVDLRLCEVFSTAPSIKNISKCHQLQCINNNVTGFLISKDGYDLNKTF